MLTLYERTGCPFCIKVLRFAEENGITLQLKNSSDEAVVEELTARGGKRQFPYLVDNEHNVEMYESDDIIEYLRTLKV